MECERDKEIKKKETTNISVVVLIIPFEVFMMEKKSQVGRLFNQGENFCAKRN